MTQLRIPAVYMRGGTSKGVFFLADDLPSSKRTREQMLLRVIGSPDTYGRQMDGMGGATSSTSKIVIVWKSSRSDCDAEYLFGRVAIDAPVIDWSGNCGSLTAAVVSSTGSPFQARRCGWNSSTPQARATQQAPA